MTINITQLKEEYKDKKSPEYLRRLIIRLYSSGKDPTKITTAIVCDIFGYDSQPGYLQLVKPYKGLSPLLEDLIKYYKPRVHFDPEKILIGQSRSKIDRVYNGIITNPGILQKELMEKLNLSESCVMSQAKRLAEYGLVVAIRWYDRNTSHSNFKYFPTECSSQISPLDLKIFKSIRYRRSLEYLVALYLFGEITGSELAKFFGVETRSLSKCFDGLIARGIVEITDRKHRKYRKYGLVRDSYDMISHLLNYFGSWDEKNTDNFVRYLRYKWKFGGKKLKVDNMFLRELVIKVRESSGITLAELATKLEISRRKLTGYLYQGVSVPFEVLAKLISMDPYTRWRDAESNIEVKIRVPAILERERNAEAILEKYELSEILQRIQEKRLIGERWRVINKELRELPTFKKLRQMKSGSIKDISNALKRNQKKPSLLRMLHELKVLKELDYVEEKSGIYQIN